MPEMKDSGIEWVGEIPKKWNLIPIRYLFSEVTRKNSLLQAKKALKFTYGTIIPKMDFEADSDEYVARTMATYTVVSPGMIMINCLNLNYDFVSQRIGLVNDNGAITSAYLAIKPSENVVPRFANYQLKSWDAKKAFHNMGSGVRKTLDFSELGKKYFPLPPLAEQSRIADFLDSKCSEIDALTADIQKEIEVLEEYKKSVITEAVTKGLDPNAEMKDSGIEWVGKIPRDWKINRIKHLFKSSKGLSITKENLIDEGLPVISYGQIHSKTNTGVDIDKNLLRFVSYDYRRFSLSKMERYDFAFADTSEDYDGCGNCVYKRTDDELYGGYHVVILKSVNKQDNRFFAYLFQTDAWRKQIRTKVSGIKVFSVTQKIINEASVIIPSISEQSRIADFLDSKCSEIDNVIAEKREQLTTLEEYKKSVIYEYVTGKKEVTAQ